MSPTDAAEEVSHLKGLFPGISQHQEDFWFEQFQQFPQKASRAAVVELATTHGSSDFVDRPALIRLIGIKAGTHDPTSIRAKAAAQSADAIASEKRSHADADAAWKRVDLVLNRQSDASIEQLKNLALSQLKPDAKSFLSQRDARKNPVLRGLIFELLEGSAA